MKNTAEDINTDDNVVIFQEALEAKAGGSHGGFDYFSGMTVGTRFACFKNGGYGSLCDEYVLLQKSGPSVLLLNAQINDDVHWALAQERHLGQKFWKLNTMVQILHDPDKDKNNGKRVSD